jgi:hypothetical protein
MGEWLEHHLEGESFFRWESRLGYKGGLLFAGSFDDGRRQRTRAVVAMSVRRVVRETKVSGDLMTEAIGCRPMEEQREMMMIKASHEVK